MNSNGIKIKHSREEEICRIFAGMSDIGRLRILLKLSEKEYCVHSLCEEFSISQSALSHQLRILRDLRIVKHRKEGRHVYYSLDDRHIFKMIKICAEHTEERYGNTK
ncbi:MAG: ArsR/SmtB family transcription factor [Fibrobacterota bacterium]